MLLFEILFIGLIVVLQLYTFFDVKKKMELLRSFFPKDFERIEVGKLLITKQILKDNQRFSAFISSIPKGNQSVSFDEGEESEEVEVLVLDDNTKNVHQGFNEVILSTNAYLCKNKGASADFNILQDICERHIQRLDNSISNLINVPLYIGLAGTFLGIIIGLWGIDFTTDNGAIDPKSINQLLNGVIAAMIASLLGLSLTVWNTALNYKPAAYQNDTDKNHYYDFIQRELLPVLNVGMAGSLTNFRSVLNHFIVKFGENINEYHDTAELLNDNLSKQQFVLEEINKLSLTRTSKAIVEAFVNLKESSEQLKMFLDYQKSLNENVTEAKQVVLGLNGTLQSFKSFNSNLDALAKNINSSIELQSQFKSMLELHFPTIKDHREVWRAQVDELNTDIKGVYSELVKYFQESTNIIQTFIQNNESFFTGLNDIQKTNKIFVESAKIQNEQFKTLNSEIAGLRKDFNSSQDVNLALNKDLVEAIKSLTLKLSKLEVVTTQDNSNGKD